MGQSRPWLSEIKSDPNFNWKIGNDINLEGIMIVRIGNWDKEKLKKYDGFDEKFLMAYRDKNELFIEFDPKFSVEIYEDGISDDYFNQRGSYLFLERYSNEDCHLVELLICETKEMGKYFEKIIGTIFQENKYNTYGFDVPEYSRGFDFIEGYFTRQDKEISFSGHHLKNLPKLLSNLKALAYEMTRKLTNPSSDNKYFFKRILTEIDFIQLCIDNQSSILIIVPENYSSGFASYHLKYTLVNKMRAI